MLRRDGSQGVTNAARSSLVRNVLSSWTVLATAILTTLLMTPAIVRTLDREAYGIWSFLNAFVAYSSLFYLGLGSALLRFGAEYHASGQREAFNRLASVVMTIYSGIGLFSFAVGLVAAGFLPELFSASDRGSISAALVILAARVALMFNGAGFAGIIVSQGRMDLYCLVGICGHLSRLMTLPFALGAADPLFALALVVALTGTAEVIVMGVMAFRLDPALKIRPVKPSIDELRHLYGFGINAFFIQLADRLISYTDTLVIGLLLGASQVALYVLPLQLAEYGRMTIRGLTSVMLPHLSALLATGQRSRFRRAYLRMVRTSGLFGAFVAVNLVALGPMFLRLWVGPSLADFALPVLMFLGIAVFAQAIAVDAQTPFFLAQGKGRGAAIVLLVEALVNLVLSLTLARPIGIVGVALATAVPAVLVSGLALTVRGAREADVPLGELVRKVLLPVGVFAAGLIAVQAGLAVVLKGTSILVFGARLVLGALFAVCAGWYAVPAGDRRGLLVGLRRVLRGRRQVLQPTPTAV